MVKDNYSSAVNLPGLQIKCWARTTQNILLFETTFRNLQGLGDDSHFDPNPIHFTRFVIIMFNELDLL